MKSIYIIILTVYCSNIIAQHPYAPYEKLDIISPKPIWYETTFSSNCVSDTSDGYNCLDQNFFLKNFVKDSFIYVMNETENDGINNWGALIEKRNLNTGKLIWQYSYDNSNLTYQEAPKTWFIEGNKLIIIGIRKNELYMPSWDIFYDFEQNARMTYRAIDIDSGQIIEEYNTNIVVESSEQIMISMDPTGIYSNIFLTEHKDKFRYTENIKFDKKGKRVWAERIKTFILDKKGNRVSEIDTIVFGGWQRTHNLHQISLDTFVFYKTDSVTAKVISLDFYDKSFNKLNSVPLEQSQYTIGYSYVLKATKKHILIGSEWEPNLFYLIYDYNGKLLNQFTIDLMKTGYSLPQVQYLENRDVLIVGAGKRKNSVSMFDVFKVDKTGTADTLFSLKKEQDQRGVFPTYIEEIEEIDKVLFNFSETAYKPGTNGGYEYDFRAGAMSTMLFNPEDIGLEKLSSVTLENIQKPKIHPNPTNDILNIEGLNDISKLTIHNINGQKLLTRNLSDRISNVQLDVSELQQGIYIIMFQGNNKQVSQAKFVKL